jgi:Ni,Fe-hydrogenase III small subunit
MLMTSDALGFKTVIRRLQNLVSHGGWLTERDPRSRQPRSTFFRHLDAGSCNDCELEIVALSNPMYDFERFGFQIVASPRHADVLLVTGPFTRSMEAAALATFRAMPEPRAVVTIGDGFRPDGLFGISYAVTSLPQEMIPYWVAHILGGPPSPQHILDVLLNLATP